MQTKAVKKYLSGLFVVGLLGVLGGCANFKLPWEKDITLPCPGIQILQDTASITQFQEGAGRDLIDVRYEGVIERFVGTCEYDIDTDTMIGTLTADVALAIDVSRGPAAKNRSADFSYFLAIVGDDGTIFDKAIFDVGVDFPANVSRLQVRTDPTTLNFPVSEGKNGGNYQIYAGFQLTNDQIAFNRERLKQR